jgi:hypothetical protein
MKRTLFLLPLVVILASCETFPDTTPASPQVIGGKYYMTGDEPCKTYSQTDQQKKKDEITCINEEGKPTEVRKTMTAEEMQMWVSVQQIEIEKSKAIRTPYRRQNTRTNCVQFGNILNCTQL